MSIPLILSDFSTPSFTAPTAAKPGVTIASDVLQRKEPEAPSLKASEKWKGNHSDVLLPSGNRTTFSSLMKTNEPSSAHLVTYFIGSFLDTESLSDEEVLQKQATDKMAALKKPSERLMLKLPQNSKLMLPPK